MTVECFNGASAFADRYQTFIFDLWGVLHDGITAFPAALDVLHRLRVQGRQVALMSNAPRPGPVVAEEMKRLGIEPDFYDLLQTSGDTAIAAYNGSPDLAGKPHWHMGPDRSRVTAEACQGDEVGLDDAETIICTGPFDDEKDKPEDYKEMLAPAAARGVVMICANPDIVVNRGSKLVPCAGAIADVYAGLGGQVRRYGKPYADAYDMLLDRLHEAERSRAVMIGDGFPTDVKGAAAAGIDCVFVAAGIHAGEIKLDRDGAFDREAVAALARRHGVPLPAVLGRLIW